MVLPDHRSLSTEEPPISTPSLRAASCLFWLGKEVRRQKGKQSPGNRCLSSLIIYKNSGFSKSLTQRNIPSSVHQEQVGRKQIKGPVRLSFRSPHWSASRRQGQMPGKEDSEGYSSWLWRLRGEGPLGQCLAQMLWTLSVEATVPLHIPLLVGMEFATCSLVGPCLPWSPGAAVLGQCAAPEAGPGSSCVGRTCQAQPTMCVTWKQPYPFSCFWARYFPLQPVPPGGRTILGDSFQYVSRTFNVEIALDQSCHEWLNFN